MRKIAALLLLITMLFAACSVSGKKPDDPVTFYYHRAQLTYGSTDSVIAGEIRDAADFSGDITRLLNAYLAGPGSDSFRETFPTGAKVVSFSHTGTSAEVVLSAAFARLDGIELSIACACLAKTVMELTEVSTVTIRSATDDNEKAVYVTMNEASLLLLDTGAP